MRRILRIPAKAKVSLEEIYVEGDVVIADRAKVDRKVETEGKIFIGRYVEIGGLKASGDIYVDDWTTIRGDIYSDSSISLGDMVKVLGRLYCGGDLEIGGNVEIEKGFLAKGYINISKGLPLFAYLLLYLMYLLQVGKSEEIEKVLKALEEEVKVEGDYLLIPYDAIFEGMRIEVKSGAQLGPNSEVYGNLISGGRVIVSSGATLHGGIKAEGNVYVGPYSFVEGKIFGRNVKISRGAVINGGIEAESVKVSKGAEIYGKVVTKEGLEFLREEEEDKIKREELIPEIDKFLGE